MPECVPVNGLTPPSRLIGVAGAQSLEMRLELARLLNRVGAPCSARQRQDRLGFLVGDVVADVDRDLALRGEPCLGVGQDFVARAVRIVRVVFLKMSIYARSGRLGLVRPA